MDRFDIIPYSDLSPESTWIRLGRGSFGCVYKGKYLGMTVAIKEVLESKEYDVQKYFQRECKIMQEARHPNVVQYIGLSLAPSSPTFEQSSQSQTQQSSPKRILIISEFLPRGNLRQYILSSPPPPSTLPFHDPLGKLNPKFKNFRAGKRKQLFSNPDELDEDLDEDDEDEVYLPMPWRLRISFAVDVTRAVAYLHARGCMHRDLKGENLLVTENERLKVCDFGFARLIARSESERKRITFCGTDGYMSPEILMGEEFGLETDIFSLGVIFCELASRRLVSDDTFKRQMPSFTLDEEEVRSLASPGCPSSFIALALSCCSRLPKDRPTILQVLERLKLVEAEIVSLESEGKLVDFELEEEEGGGGNVGSLKFSGSVKGSTAKKGKKSGKDGRPNLAPRLPSFEGQIKLPYGSSVVRAKAAAAQSNSSLVTSSSWNSSSDSYQDPEDLKSLIDMIGNITVPKGKLSGVVEESSGISSSPSKGGDGGTAEGSDYSVSVIKGSKIKGSRISILPNKEIEKQGEGEGSSTLTIKVGKKIAGEIKEIEEQEGRGTVIFVGEEHTKREESGSLPSIPSEWIKQSESKKDLSSQTSPPSSSSSSEGDFPPTPTSPKSIPLVTDSYLPTNSKIGTIKSEQFYSAFTGTPSLAAATIHGDDDDDEQEIGEASETSLTETGTGTETETEEGEVPEADEQDLVSPLPTQTEPNPTTNTHQQNIPPASFGHRFSIVKASWVGQWKKVGSFGVANSKRLSLGSGTSGGSGGGSSVGWGMGLGNRCGECGKRLGVLKDYLECDDCSFKCHLKCSASVPRNCPGASPLIPLSSLPNGISSTSSSVIHPPPGFASSESITANGGTGEEGKKGSGIGSKLKKNRIKKLSTSVGIGMGRKVVTSSLATDPAVKGEI